MRDSRNTSGRRPKAKVRRAVDSRSHGGAPKPLIPRPDWHPRHSQHRAIVDGLLKALIGQNLGQTTGAWLHPGRTGGVGAFSPGFKPKLPGFMAEPATAPRFTFQPGSRNDPLAVQKVAANKERLQNLLLALKEEAGSTAFDRAHPRLSPRYPVAQERRLLGYGPPGGDFLSHLARLQDPVANRAFLQWMMEHHYRRPN